MNVLLLLAHPEPASFCGALFRTAADRLAKAGHRVRAHDLYAEHFDPVGGRQDFATVKNPDFFKYQAEQNFATEQRGFAADVATEQEKLLWCDLVIFHFPLWWFTVPAILKGWFDRVLAQGFAYGGGRWYETGPLAPRRAMLAMTAGAPRERYAEGAIFGGIERVLYPIHVGTLNLVGLAVHEPFIAWAAARVGDGARQDYLAAFARRLDGIEREAPLKFHTIADHPDPYAKIFR